MIAGALNLHCTVGAATTGIYAIHCMCFLSGCLLVDRGCIGWSRSHYTSVSVVLVSLHCIVGAVMTGMYCSLYVFSFRMSVELTGDVLVGVSHTTWVCFVPVGLHCAVGIAMIGIHYSLYVLSYRMPVKLTGDALIGINDTPRVCLSFW